MKSKIDSLQILRAFAATFVVINHLWGDSQTAISLRLGLQYIGDFGVDAFFILSGFIMSYKTREDSRLGLSTALDFIKKRVERIYPLFLLVLTPFLLIYLLKNHPASLYQIFGNILLLPTFTSDPNYLMLVGPSWSLVYEMFFYLIYAVIMMLVPNKRSLVFTTASLIVLMVLVVNFFSLRGPRLDLNNFSYMIGDTLMINFAIGCVYAQIFMRLGQARLPSLYACPLIVIFFLLGMWLSAKGAPRFVCFGLTSLAIVFLFSLMRESQGKIYRLLVYVGNASYSIYITHYFFEYSKHFFFTHFNINHDLFGIVFSIIAVIFGCIFYSQIETRIARGIRSLQSSRAAAARD